MYEWRTRFGNVAIDVLTGHLSGINLDLRVTHVCNLLNEQVRGYLYKDVETSPSGQVVCTSMHITLIKG
jgi:hypothetical protein